MKIRILRNTVCDGRVVEAGEVVEAKEENARILIALKKAMPESRNIEPAEKAILPRGEKRSKKHVETDNASDS